MKEVEIKFFIQPSSLKAITQAMCPPGAPRRQRLRAQYFDTPDRDLAQRRAALRLRQEGRQWVQTFKMAGEHVLERLELNHRRPGPVLDLSVYEGTPAQAVMAACGDRLALRYETNVLRATRLIKTRTGSVELAFDSGTLRAGERHWPVQELEFELKSGQLNALFEVAHRWLREHDLVLDLRSKSEQGDRLASVPQAASTLTYMEAVAWPQSPELSVSDTPEGKQRGQDKKRPPADAPPRSAAWEQFLRAIGGSMVVLFRNTAGLARFGQDLPEAGADHAAAAFQVLASWDAACRLFPEVAEAGFIDLVLDAEPLVNELRPYLRARTAAAALDPLYDEVGLAPTLRTPAVQLDIQALMSARDFQAWQLSVLAWLLGCDAVAATPSLDNSADKLLRRVYPYLKKWQKSLSNRLAAYGTLSSSDKFKVRRTLERLDHCAFLLQGLIKTDSYQRIRSTYQEILLRLAQMEALTQAMLSWRAQEQATPQVWFALGWATAKQAALVQELQALSVNVRRLDWRR